jgi:hypothetical protein
VHLRQQKPEREAAEGQPVDRAKDVRASVAEVAKPHADQEWPEQALDRARLIRIFHYIFIFSRSDEFYPYD